MTTIPPHPLSTKPRRWYRRRGWQILLVLLSLFTLWFTWAIVAANDRNAIVRRIAETPDCQVQYGWPGWALNLHLPDWLPQKAALWVHEQVSFADSFQFGREKQLPLDEPLLAAVADRSWPSLAVLNYHNQKLWTGSQLLLPLRCPNLKCLILDNTNLTDDHLKIALRCYPLLYTLEISNHAITEHALTYLNELPGLTNLTLDQCDVTSLDFLSKAPRLEYLDLSNIGISDQHLKSLRYCPELKELWLDHLSLKGSTLDQLRYCKKLETLSLDHNEINDDNIKLLPLLPTLTYISLEGNSISGINLFTNGVPSRLETLVLNKTKFQLKHLGILKGHSTLRYLKLDNTPTSDEGSEWLSTLSELDGLDMNNTIIGDKTFQTLLPATKIFSIEAKHTRITDNSGVSFRQMLNLYVLDVGQTAISNNFLVALSGHPTLEGLSIQNTRINDQGVPHLLKIPKLNRVYASLGQFSPKAVQELKEHEIEVILPDKPESEK